MVVPGWTTLRTLAMNAVEYPRPGHFGEARIIRRRRAVHAHPLAPAFRIGAIEGAIDVHPADAAREGRAADLGAVAIHIDLLVGRAEEDRYRPVV